MVQLVTPQRQHHELEDLAAWAYSIDAEQSVVGALLINNAAYEDIADLVRAEHFFQRDHRIIFEHTARLIENGKAADALTVAESLSRDRLLDEVGGQAYVGSLAVNTPSAANIRRYAEIVVERATFRALNAACTVIMDAVRRPGQRDARALVDQAQAAMMVLGERSGGAADFQSSHQVMTEVIAFVEEQHERYRKLGDAAAVTGLETGFYDFDRMTSGLHPGQLIVLAARPSMGKSAMALNISEHVTRANIPTLFFSLEMGNREQGVRLLASRSGMNTQRLFSGRVNENEWPRVVNAVGELVEIPLLFNDSPYLTVMDMRSMARRAKRQHPTLGLIVVDYLQLMVAGASEQNRANQIAEISRGLKLLAKELGVPVMALAQLNRELEKRQNKRPVLSDLRDSGAIEQDADMVVFIYRDEVYNEDSPRKGIAELIVAKQRNGPVGTVQLVFRKDNTRFENYAG